MTKIPLEVLEFERMASGHKSLRLTRVVTWREFSRYAKRVVRVLNGKIMNRADSPVERVWTVSIEGALYWISFDDFALGVSIDPCDHEAAAAMETLRARLLAVRGGRRGQTDLD